MSKFLVSILKFVLLLVVLPQQFAYVEERFTGEVRRLFSNITEMTKTMKTKEIFSKYRYRKKTLAI